MRALLVLAALSVASCATSRRGGCPVAEDATEIESGRYTFMVTEDTPPAIVAALDGAVGEVVLEVDVVREAVALQYTRASGEVVVQQYDIASFNF